MKIRILASGEIRHIDNSTGSALVSAGLAEVVSKNDSNLPVPGDFKPTPPKWAVLVLPDSKTLVIRMSFPSSVMDYFGPPKDANRIVQNGGVSRYVSGFGREVPSEIVSEYTRQWKSNERLRGVPAGLQAAAAGGTNTQEKAAKEFADSELKSGRVRYTPDRVIG